MERRRHTLHRRPAPLRRPADRVSADGAVALRYQSDGNLVLYGSGGAVLWDTGTWGTSAGRAEMQTDGNFVIYDAARHAGLGHRHHGVERLSARCTARAT